MNALARIGLACAACLVASLVHAEDCRRVARPDGRRSTAADCRPAAKLEPFDPDRVKAGRDPGFIDFGGGTEVRVGGRARMDYDVRR